MTTPKTAFNGGNGTLTLPLGWRGLWRKITLTGGPWRTYMQPANVNPEVMPFGVCLLDRPNDKDFNVLDLNIPIADFSVPEDEDFVTTAIREIFEAALRGQSVYVGCGAGWGRTGLVLALCAKAAGLDKPVEFVREHYTSRAVETPEQYEFVTFFDVTPIRTWLLGFSIERLLGQHPDFIPEPSEEDSLIIA